MFGYTMRPIFFSFVFNRGGINATEDSYQATEPSLYLSCNHFVAIVVLSSFHDDVTEVSFVWLHNEAYINI